MALGSRRTAKQPLPLHERALGLLAVRQRSRRELRSRLVGAGFSESEVDDELTALEAVGLVDDDAFARAAAERGGRRLDGRRAVVSNLISKGVARQAIDRALDDGWADAGEEVRAFELARSRAARFGSLSPEVAHRRLVGLLARRGYAPGLARRAAAAALSVEPDPGDG